MGATLPKWTRLASAAFPGAETKLPAAALGALVSLCFNRGTSMAGDRRREMWAIRDHIVNHRGGSTIGLKVIAELIRIMKRLWIGKGVHGLLKRRDAEARMVETA